MRRLPDGLLTKLPEGLLAVAEGLVPEPHTRVARACLRRAASTAYYALFHLLVRAAVQRMFSNDPHRRDFGPLAARGFTHTGIKAVVVEALRAPANRGRQLDALLGAAALSTDLTIVCDTFVAAHAAREDADYDLAAKHLRSSVEQLVQQVRDAFEAWERVSTTDEGIRFAIALSLLARTRK